MGIKLLLLNLALLYCICYALAAGEKAMPTGNSEIGLTDINGLSESILSHKVHAGTLKLDCGFCHRKKADGSADLSAQVCSSCHILPQDSFFSKSTVELLQHISTRIKQGEEVEEYEKSEFFKHEIHATLKCSNCHEEDSPVNAERIELNACERCHYAAGKTFPYWRRPKQVDTLCKLILEK